MDTQKKLEEVIRLAPIINDGKEAFTESEEVKDHIIDWYGQHGTKIESKKDNKGFWLWNPNKISK